MAVGWLWEALYSGRQLEPMAQGLEKVREERGRGSYKVH